MTIGAQIAIGMAAAGEAGGVPIAGNGADGEASVVDAASFEALLAGISGRSSKPWDLAIEMPIETPIDADTGGEPPVAPIAVPVTFVPVPQEWWALAPSPTGLAGPAAVNAVSESISVVTESVIPVTEPITMTVPIADAPAADAPAANAPVANAPATPLVDTHEVAGNAPPQTPRGGSVVGESREHTPPSNTGQAASGAADVVTVESGGQSAGTMDSPGDTGEHASQAGSYRFVTPNREGNTGADPAAAPPEILASGEAPATLSAILIQGTAQEDLPPVLEAGAPRTPARIADSAPIAPIQVRPAEPAAVAVAPVAELSAPPDGAEGQDLFDQMVQAVRWQWNGMSGAVRVRLQPEYLGAVSIDLQVQGGDVRAAVTADTPFVRQWIESHASELRAALSGQELVLSELVVRDEAQAKQRRPPPERRHAPARTRPGSPQETFSIMV